jgi:hypothetical protein
MQRRHPTQPALSLSSLVNIEFLAIDFDCTILDIHTGGRFQGTSEELVSHVRPMFATLLRKAAQHEKLVVAIVTFSFQVDLIRNLLETILGRELSDRIVIRGGNGRGPSNNSNGHQNTSWAYHGAGVKSGKQSHMASAVEELEALHKVQLTKANTLLIDDDVKNVKTALREGVRALWLNPNQPERLMDDMQRLV